MLAGWFGGGFGVALGVTLAVTSGSAFNEAEAANPKVRNAASHVSAIHSGINRAQARTAQPRTANRGRFSIRRFGNVLQCVPFARENSGIELTGNANTWWDSAGGIYERGAKPEVGSILNFRSTGRMRMGHVAVVTNVVDSRHIEIDHANWSGPGRVTRDIDVVDVSPDNDWTAVRVALGRSDDEFGSVYPTYGFIYDRPDNGVMVANSGITPVPLLNPAPADYRSASDRISAATAETAPEEVAEAVDDVAPRATRHRAARSSTRAATRLRVQTAPQAAMRRVMTRQPARTPASPVKPRRHHPRT